MTASMIIAGCFVFAPVALASPPSRVHVAQYSASYHTARSKFGPRAVGCNLVGRRGSCHSRTTDEDLVRSLGVLHRMLRPAPVGVVVGYVATQVNTRATLTVTPASGLAACIVRQESGGNPQAVNGRYSGIGQWEQSRWLADGGGRYAPTPLGATYAEQLSVLEGEGAAGMRQQQGQYDGC